MFSERLRKSSLPGSVRNSGIFPFNPIIMMTQAQAFSATRPLFRRVLSHGIVAMCAIATFSAQAVHGAEITQTRPFSITRTGSGTGTLTVVGLEGLVGTGFTPFDSSLGTLTSFSVKWDATLTTSATVSPSSTGGGGFSAAIAAGCYLNAEGNSGLSVGGGGGAAPGAVVTSSPVVISKLITCPVPDSPRTYNQAWLAGVTGASNFNLSLGGTTPIANVDHNGLSSISSTLVATVTLTYTYAPTSSPATYNTSTSQVLGGWINGGSFTLGTVNTHWPSAESPDKAVDNNTGSKFLAFRNNNAGLILSPTNATLAFNRLLLSTANDSPERDPASYVIYGSPTVLSGAAGANLPLSGLTLLASGTITLPDNRTTGPTVVQFANTTPYASYIVAFPTVRSTTSNNITQISEVQLSQGTNPPHAVAMAGARGGQLSGGTFTFGSIGSNNPGTNWLANEGPDQAIDDRLDTKYLLFRNTGAGLIVSPQAGPARVNRLRFWTANDFAERDPLTYQVYGFATAVTARSGTLNVAANGTLLGSGTLTLPATRYAGPHTVTFTNSTPYASYLVVFPTVKNSPSTTMMQIAEVQFGYNGVPAFALSASTLTVARDSGSRSEAAFATDISAGIGDVGQTVSFSCTNDNNALFSTQPAISAEGTLTFTPAANAFGRTTVSVIATDNTGLVSSTKTFVIEVTPGAFVTSRGSASASQTLAIKQSGYTGPVTITAPAGYEISTDGSTFSSSLTVRRPAGTIQSVYDGDFNTATGAIWAMSSGREVPNPTAFAALKSDGSVVTWGWGNDGGDSSTVADQLNSNVSAIYSNEASFAALKNDGSVVTWGTWEMGGNFSIFDDSEGVDIPAVGHVDSGVVEVYSTSSAYAALKSDGSVVTWGWGTDGGDSSGVANQLTSGVTAIRSSLAAFAALKNNGSVVTWGDEYSGGNSTSVAANLNSGVTALYSNASAFAAVKSNGAVVTWGDSGMDLSPVAGRLSSGVVSVQSTEWAFAALKDDGSVVTWGDPEIGGDPVIYGLAAPISVASELASGVTRIFSNPGAFAALKSNGSVVTWGHAADGGDSSSAAARLTSGVTAISSSYSAFAALKNDGSVVTWGDGYSGGNSTGVASSLASGVTAVYSNGFSFAALKSDGSVVTWGHSGAGGDSSSVAAQLDSGVIAIYSTEAAYAAVKNDGSVVTWGAAQYGGAGGPSNIGVEVPLPATIHVRLTSTAAVGPVTGNLTLTSNGAATQTIALSGTVTSSLSPSTQTLSAVYGTAITPTIAITPTGLSGAVSYTISPALPSGLSLNSETGVISGTPTAVKATSTIYTITGSGAIGGSASASVALTVAKAPLTVVAVDKARAYGAANPSFSATFNGLVNGDTLGVISGSASLTTAATSNSAPGTYTITASIGTLSATNYSFSNFTAGTLTIGKAAQVITIAPLANAVPLKDLSSVNLSATSTSGLPVTLSLGAGSAASLSGTSGSYSLTDIGTTGIVNVLANQAGDDNYAAATEVVATFDVTKSNQTITFGALANKTYGDPAITLTATSDSAQAVSYVIASGPAILNGGTLTLTGAGTVVVRANQAGNDSYNAAPAVERSFTVAPKQLTVTGAVAADKFADESDVATISGAQLVGVISGDEVTLSNETAGTFSQSGAGTDLTVTTNMTLAGADAANYTLTQPDLTATISVPLPSDYMASDGTLDVNYLRANGSKLTIVRYGIVSRSAFDASGRWLVAGTFAGYDGISSNSLIRLNPDGSADATFNANMGSGLANLYDSGNVNLKSLLVRKNGQIMVGGAFTSLNGVSLPRGIACLHPDGTPDTTFNTKLNALSFRFGNEAMVEQPDGKIIGDHSSGGVCRLNPDGTLDSTFVNIAGRSWVTMIKRQRDGKLLVGGSFSSYGGQPLAGLVRLNADGTMDTAFNDALGTGFPRDEIRPAVTTTAIAPDGKIWVGGHFSSFNGRPVPGLVRLNPDGTLDSACQTAIGTPFTGSTYSLIGALCLQPDGKIVVGGLFNKFHNLSTSGLFRLNSDGSPDLAFSRKFGSGVDWSVMTIGIRSTGELMIGGYFSKIGSQSVKNIAQLVWSGTLVPETQTLAATYGSAITPTSTFTTSRLNGTVSYAISPALPSGLSLNTSTGVISGTPRSVVTTPRAYTITATGSVSGSATSSVTLSVAKAPLTVTANPTSRAYGKSNPIFGVRIDGLVNGDTSSVISGKPSYACVATTSSSPGIYPIIPSMGSLSAINYSFSSFETGSLTVEKAIQTLSLAPLATSVPLKELGSVSLSATSSAGLPVTLSLDAGSAATLSGSVGSYALTDIGQTGTVTVRASQSGNSNYSAAQDVVVSFDVTKSNQAITFGTLAGKTFGDAPFDLSATADSGLPVSFSLVSGPAELQGATVSLTGAGTVIIRASQAGNNIYNEASAVIRSFTVTPAAQTITFGTLAAVTYGDVPSALSATSDSGLAITYEVVSGPAALNGVLLAPTAAGTVVVRASQAGDDNHLAAEPVERSLTINRKVVTVTGATALDKAADESTAAQIAGAELSGVMDGDDVALTNQWSGTFSQATPGSGLAVTTSMTLEGADAGNYLLTQPSLTATITAPEITHTHQEEWRFANFGSYDSVASGADSADPDGDGLNNLLEYALGTAPNSSGVMPAALVLNGANLEYTYTRSTAAKDNGVTYQIEWSETLEAGSWSTETVSQQITSTEGALETVKTSVPAGAGGKRFLRLRVGAPVGGQ